MIKQHILTELKQFIDVASNQRTLQKNILSPLLIRNSLNLLEDLPAAREVIFEFFGLVFDASVVNHVVYVRQNIDGTPPEDEVINVLQEALENLVTKGPPAWSPLIASWTLDLIGRLSHKYSLPRPSIGVACNYWLNCSAMRSLLGLVASCFQKMNSSDTEHCISTLLATYTRFFPTFDWVVARLGVCFPLKIISHIFQYGLKRFAEEPQCNFNSEIDILVYLSFTHEKDLRQAIKDLLEDGFYPKSVNHAHIIPYLMQLATNSSALLQPIVSVFLDMFNDKLIETIIQQTNLWLQNFAFRDMQPSLNNIALKLEKNGTKLLLTVARIAEKYNWCQDFLEYTIQELEQLVLKGSSCELYTDLATNESKSLLLKSCVSTIFLEQQTAVRLLLLISTEHPHIYYQTIADLLMLSNVVNKNLLSSLVRIIIGLSGTTDFPEINPGIETALERVLIQKQFHANDQQVECLNAIKNMMIICKLEKNNSCQNLKSQPMSSALIKCLSKLLDIMECVLNKLSTNINSTSNRNTAKLTPKIKRQKSDNPDEEDRICFPKLTSCGELVHAIVQLLIVIEAGTMQNITQITNILKLAHLTAKYFFWVLTEKSPTIRTVSANRAFALLQMQCSARKESRSACLRELVEGCLFMYPNLFCRQANESERTDFPENERLLLINKSQDLVPNGSRSILHAGIIGKGLKGAKLKSLTSEPDAETQTLFLKAIDSCCQDTDQNRVLDGYYTVSLLLVEMVSPDIMYNGLPFPDEEFTKVTVERDLQIQRAFKGSPILWALISLVATRRPALCFASVLLRALCAAFLHQWRAKNVNRFQPVIENEELLSGTKRLLEIFAIGQLLPPPLSNLHLVIEYFEAPEIALVLKECVWNYIKDYVPSRALFQSDNNGLFWRNPALSKPPPQYVDPLRNIMQKKLPKIGSFYYQMFAMPSLIDEEEPIPVVDISQGPD